MENYFVINHKLCSLNEYINVCRRNKYQAAKFKRDVEEAIGWAIRQARAKGTLHPTDKPCIIWIDFVEKSRRRDVDNIQSSTKFILDSLVKNEVLKNDSQKYIKQIFHTVTHGDKDCVTVKIKPYNEKEVITYE
jgi:Holliday junction resolvase RusA-like endonuclease